MPCWHWHTHTHTQADQVSVLAHWTDRSAIRASLLKRNETQNKPVQSLCQWHTTPKVTDPALKTIFHCHVRCRRIGLGMEDREEGEMIPRASVRKREQSMWLSWSPSCSFHIPLALFGAACQFPDKKMEGSADQFNSSLSNSDRTQWENSLITGLWLGLRGTGGKQG